MRTDDTLPSRSFRNSAEWQRRGGGYDPQIDSRLAGVERREDGTLVVHSLSGMERNHFFLNREGRAFTDLSALSGLDTPADSRGFAVLDHNRDGWPDVALVNANEPLFSLYRNEMAAAGARGGMVALRLVGGASAGAPPGRWSNRDGVGARVTARSGDLQISRTLHCGEGFGAQHSSTLLLGIGTRPGIEHLRVRWPSGRESEILDIPEGTLLTVHENAAETGDGSGMVRAAYRRPPSPRRPADEPQAFALAEEDASGAGRLRVYTSLATWCPSCREHIPALQRLSRRLPPGEVELVAVPVDAEDDPEKLATYAREQGLPSRLLALEGDRRKRAADAFKAALGEEVLPCTVVTDAAGRVRLVQGGVPSLSELRRLLASLDHDDSSTAAAGAPAAAAE